MAKKKAVPTHIPLQQGFGFEVCDAAGNAPPFLWQHDDVIDAVREIEGVRWVATDTEGTGLTDASMPVALSPADIKQGGSNILRTRTLQVRIPTINGRRGPRKNFVFDCDKMGPALTERVCRAILSRDLYVAHNAGFDLYWQRKYDGRRTMPRMVADTMLLTRALNPTLVLKRAEMVEGVKDSTQIHHLSLEAQAAWKSLVKGGSGGSLADVVLSMFNVILDKTYQKPNNWTGLLGFEHYDYAMDDAVWADRVLCNLLGIDDEGDLYQAYLGNRARQSVVRLIEPQVPELVYLRENGMPASTRVAYNYVRRKRRELAEKVSELIALEPRLEAHRPRLSDPDAGLDDELKEALAVAFQERGVALRKTAAKGSAQVGEKDLRACRAAQIDESRPLFNAWVAVCRSKKASSMALEVAGFIERGPDGRLRSLLSHGPITGRLAASEPNCQQWPRDQLFRAICVSETEAGCEETTILVTEHNRAFMCDVMDSIVEVGEQVTVMSAWLAAMFYSTRLLDGMPDKELDKLKEHVGKLSLAGESAETVLRVTEHNRVFLCDLTDSVVNLGDQVTVDSARLVEAFKTTKLFEPMAGDERKALREHIDSLFTHVIVASDFGALDVRVGAALCVRSQREMIAAVNGVPVPGIVQPPDAVMGVLKTVIPTLDTPDAVDQLATLKAKYGKELERLEQRMETLKADMDAERIPRKQFFQRRSEVKELMLSVKLGWRLAQCLELAARRGEREYSALRDAFVADIDIHTFTGMKLVGRDPMAEFSGLSVADRKSLEKKLKKELGPRRQQGKIANLSLLYGMADAGFQEAAARGYDEHWTMKEAHDIRALWMDAYPEVELWHLWTECLQAGVVYVPDQTKENQKAVRTGWWLTRTLAGREIVALGLNAALSYQDQSSGADILGNINHRLKLDHERIFFCSINQVHDEQVFALPKATAVPDLVVIEDVMVDEANKLTMPYGVPCAVSPACGPIWVKD